jgi:hypothetical protein
MDFTNRSSQQMSDATTMSPQANMGKIKNNQTNKSSDNNDKNKILNIISIIFGIAVVILVVALLIYIALSNSSSNSESSYIYKNKLQAVFLNTGQVYFGNIQKINSSYFVLTNIFYLQTNSSSTTSKSSTSTPSVSLVKLGCELHAPYDRMIINSSQVTFWENLKSTGKVSQAVAAFNKAHPNGQQTCSNQTSSAPTSSSNVQPSTQNSTNVPVSTTKKG